MKISLFKGIKTTTPIVASKSVFKVLESIREGEYKDSIAKIRIEEDKSIRDNLKANLHYVTFCGVFESRSAASLKKHSGLACLDIDGLSNLSDIKDKIIKDKYTFSCFISPSGNGLKILVKIPFVDNNDDYKDYYTELRKHYDKYAETDSTSDISRSCYLSYDSNLFINNESDIFTDKYNRPLSIKKDVVNIALKDSNDIADRLEKWFTKRWSTTNRNSNLHAYARQMNAFGVDKSVCLSYLERYEMADFKLKEIESLVNSAYRYTSEFGTQSFEDSNKAREVKNLVVAGQSKDVICNKFTDIAPESLEAEILKHSNDLKVDEFWYYTDKGLIKLATFRFLKYLEYNNIFKYYPNKESSSFIFVKKDGNFIKDFPVSRIKDFTLNDLRSRGAIDAFELCADKMVTFSKDYLSMISTKEIDIQKDSKYNSFIYYKNFAVDISKDDFKLIEYDNIDGLVWDNQVIDRNIELSPKSDGEFKTFIWRISGEDKERYYTMKSVIGYLLHSYQNEGKPKVIIFNDEMISDDVPNGGSGKGLIHKAIAHVKKLSTIDGKGFDPTSQFAYQTVEQDTQVLLFDDIDKNFKFENLFSVITEGVVIEKKGRDAIKIPFCDSPKISITTNYTVKGDGASHKRRVFEVEMSNFFSDKHTPEDEFGHLLFSEWDKKEWASFDNFMLRCVQFYLNNGLVESNKVNLAFRKLKNNLGTEFIEFMETEPFKTPVSRKQARDSFDRQYPTIARYNTAQKFNKKIKEYCDYYEIEVIESKYNGSVTYQILNDSKEDNENIPF